MKSFYYLMFCAALMLTACENENGKGNGDIVLTGNTPEEFVVKADDSGSGQAINFTAVAPWTATVKDVTQTRTESGSDVEWIKLSAYSGEAGDVSLSLSFSKNFTGITRKAEILIQCGETTIKITIEQVAENADGTITKQVKTVNARWEYNSTTINNTGETTIGESSATYSYDDKGRVVKITSLDNYDNNYTYETIYDYTITDEIQVTSREYYNGSSPEEEKYIVTLNDNGNAVKIQGVDPYDNRYYKKYTIEYTEDGRVSKITDYQGNTDPEEEFYYTYDNDGYLIKAVVDDGYEDNDEYIFDIPTSYPNKYPNNNIIDMISFYTESPFFTDNESISMLSTIGRLGKSGNYFIENVEKNKMYIETPDGGVSTKNPGETIQETKFEYANFNNYNDIYSCEYDNDNNLTKVTLTSKFDIIEVSYKVVVTEDIAEVIDDITYYRCKTIDYKETKIGSDEDITTYSISYK